MPQHEFMAQDIHAAYGHAVKEISECRIVPADWEEVSDTARAMYQHIANWLNEKLAKQDQNLKTILAAISIQEEASYYLNATILEAAKQEELMIAPVFDLPGSIFVGVRRFERAAIWPHPDAFTNEEREEFKDIKDE